MNNWLSLASTISLIILYFTNWQDSMIFMKRKHLYSENNHIGTSDYDKCKILMKLQYITKKLSSWPCFERPNAYLVDPIYQNFENKNKETCLVQKLL